jgi:RNA polymerase sigma-70 factor, ECF subfamily
MNGQDIHSLLAEVDDEPVESAICATSDDASPCERDNGSGGGGAMSIGDQMLCHVRRLRRYARALLGSRDGADDLVQDTLERGLRYASTFRPDSNLRGWLMTIMHNLFVNDVIRMANLRTHVPVDDPSVVEDELMVDGHHTARLEMRDLDSALQQLPPEQREVMLLVGLDEMSYVQVAQMLNVPVGTVMSRLSRARQKLRALLLRDGTRRR